MTEVSLTMRTKFSVLHVIAEMDPGKGGVGQAVRNMAQSLSIEGVNNEIVSLDSNDATFLANETAVVHGKGPGKGPWCFNKEMSVWLNANMSRFNVVIVHGLWLYNSYAARKVWANYITKIQKDRENSRTPRLFVMPHGMLDPYFQKAEGRKLKALRNLVYWKLIEQKLVNNADGLLFTCLTEKELASQTFRPYRPKYEYVVGLGVEAPPIYSRSMSDAFLEKCSVIAGNPYLLFLSRIHPKKGVDLLIHAYDRIRNNLPNLTKLVIAGPGLDTIYGHQMQSLVNNKGLEDLVCFTGMLEGDAKWGAFYGCEAFILPSHQENFGIAVVEALACAKPVLISNQVNIWQEINSESAGLVANDSIEGCEQLLKSWLKMSEAEKIMMGLNAQNCYNQNFGVKPATKRLRDAISV